MKIEDIMALWEKDSVIDKTELGDAALNITRLHEKYLKIYTIEKLVYNKQNKEYKVLWKDKYEFYTQGPSKETQDKGWVMPAKGKILKQEVDIYMESDPQLGEAEMKMELTKAKLEYLESVLKVIHNMNYKIRAAIDWQKFVLGG
jgi:hypothetical protein